MAKKNATTNDSLTAALAERRHRSSSSWETEQGTHKRRHARVLEDMEEAAKALAGDVSAVLSEHFEELMTHSHEFRTGMHRLFLRVLRMAAQRPEQVVLFNEAVPGFTLMLFKKDPTVASWDGVPDAEQPLPDASLKSPESVAAGHLVGQFVQRTGDRVLTVESDDALFVFFPASDMKKNLKEMGFYHVD